MSPVGKVRYTRPMTEQPVTPEETDAPANANDESTEDANVEGASPIARDLAPEVVAQGFNPVQDYDNAHKNFAGGPYLHEDVPVAADAEVEIEVAGEPTGITETATNAASDSPNDPTLVTEPSDEGTDGVLGVDAVADDPDIHAPSAEANPNNTSVEE